MKLGRVRHNNQERCFALMLSPLPVAIKVFGLMIPCATSFLTHLLGGEAEQSLESQGSSRDFRIHMSGYAPLIRLHPLFSAFCDHEIIFVYRFALDGVSPCVQLLQGETGNVTNRFFFNLAVFAVTMPQQSVGILAIGSDVEVVGFGFFAHVLLFFAR